jgi:glucose-1-phosphate adenylyltransferase
MGNYLFRHDVLRNALAEAVARGEFDFGRHVLPRLITTHGIYAYDFSSHVVPGTRASEERPYWRDVGTIEAYVAAHWDLLGPQPRFCLDNPRWPVLPHSGAREVHPLNGGEVRNSIIGPGSSFAGASLEHSVLQRGVRVDADAALEHCVVMTGARVKRGARLRRAVVGPGSTLEAGVAIGHGPGIDRSLYVVTSSGTVVVPPKIPARGLVT